MHACMAIAYDSIKLLASNLPSMARPPATKSVCPVTVGWSDCVLQTGAA